MLRLLSKRIFAITIGAFVLSLVAISALSAVPHAFATGPQLVQQASGGGPDTSYTITFSQSVTAGDLIVVSESEGSSGCDCDSFPVAISDSFSDVYGLVVQKIFAPLEASIWYAFATKTGSDQITVTLNGCIGSGGSPCGNNGAVAYDLTGFAEEGTVGSGGGSASAPCCSVASFTPPSGSDVFAAAGEAENPDGWSAGTSFTLSSNVSPAQEAQSEYLVGWGGGSTTAPMSSTGASVAWVEAAAGFPAISLPAPGVPEFPLAGMSALLLIGLLLPTLLVAKKFRDPLS